MRKLKQSVQQAATLSLLVSLVFGSLMPAFSMPVFALEKSSIEDNQQPSLIDTNTLSIQPAEKPIELEPVPEFGIQPIDIGQIKPVEIVPEEEIVPKEDLLPPEDANRDGEEPEPYIQKDEIKSLTDKLNINTDTNTGAFNYTYPIEIPAGRNNLQPDLALSYNNQDTNNQNLFGYGWSLNIPSIERLNKTGIDNLYTDNYFTSSLGGELAPISLSDDVHGTYGPRVENGDFLKYEYTTSSTWIITDKMGTVYTFGKIQADRQDNPNDNTKVYKWMLSEVRDTNDNFIRYQYYKDAGQIYPEKIFYTGHGETDGVFEIEFVREERPDNLSSFQTGFAVVNNYRFSQILVKIDGQWQKKYYLNYETGDNGNRSLLSGVQVAAPSQEQGLETAMPEDDFGYNEAIGTWVLDESIILPGDGANTIGTRDFHVFDINGDSLADIVNLTDEDYYVRGVYINQGNNTWQLDFSYALPDVIEGYGGFNVFFANLDNDGLVDIFYYDFPTSHFFLNNRHGWVETTSFTIPEDANFGGDQSRIRLLDANGDGCDDMINWLYGITRTFVNNCNNTTWTLDNNYNVPIPTNSGNLFLYTLDANGDDLLDFLYFGTTYDSNNYVSLNKGNSSGWAIDSNYDVPSFDCSGDCGVRFADINNDGFTDILHANSAENVNDVYLNNGNGTGWTLNDDYSSPLVFSLGANSNGWSFFADVNGDGLDDILKWGPGVFSNSNGVFIFQSEQKNNSLSDIYVAGEKNINIDYQSSAQYTTPGEQASVSSERDAEVLMPETAFDYPNDFESAWTDIENLDLPNIAAGYEGLFGDNGVRFGEVNGDGFIDIIHSEIKMTSHAGNIITKNVYINQGNNTWVIDSNYDIPVYFSRINNVGPYIFNEVYVEDGARLSDVNGDGLIDIIEARREADNTDTKHVYINKGDGTGWAEDLNYIIPFTFIERIETNGNSFDYDVRLADVSGDGLDDVLIAYRHYDDPHWWNEDFVDTKHIYINKGDGTGWAEDFNYVMPVVFIYMGLNVYGNGAVTATLDNGVRLVDANGDGLIDIIQGKRQRNAYQPEFFVQDVYINKGDGTGWALDENYVFDNYFVELRDILAGFIQETNDLRFMDINGDHLEDVIQSRYMYYNDQVTHYKTVSINHGDGIGWQNNPSYDIPFYFSIYDPYHEGMNDWFDNGCQIVDANGDSVNDVICSRPMYGNPHDVHNIYINNNHNKVLGEIDNNQGTQINIDYQSSAQYTESGEQVSMSSERDTEVLLPAEEFGYQKNENPGWSQDPNWQLPQFSVDRRVVNMADLNGDSYADIFFNYGPGSTWQRKTFINNQDGTWTDDPNCLPPIPANLNQSGFLVLDVNGDALVDISSQAGLFLNNGDCTWGSQAYPLPPMGVPGRILTGYETSDLFYIEINGDNLPDIVFLYPQNNTRQIYLNGGNGIGFYLDTEHIFPEYSQTLYNAHSLVIDVNADGFEDILNWEYLWVNNGDFTFSLNTPLSLPNLVTSGTRFADVNGDGLVDVLRSVSGVLGFNEVFLSNSDTGYYFDSDYSIPIYFGHRPDLYISEAPGTFIADINGDGAGDLIDFWGDHRLLYLNNVNNTDHLNNISDNVSKNINLNYQASAQSRDVGDELANPKLPYIIQTVKQINVFDGVATTTIDYQYSGGEQYFDAEHPRDKKFAGFAKVEKTIGDKTSKTYYQQANETNADFGESTDTYAKIGKVYRQEVYDAEDLKSASIQKWQEENLNTNRDLVYSPEKSQIDFASSTVMTSAQYDYDLTNGNLLAENNLGQVDLDINTGEILDTLVGDEKTTTYDYASNTTKHILSAPKEKVIADNTDTKSQELYYDDLALGQVNKVNLTKEDYVVNNVEINREFNDLGLVISETDPENNTVNLLYDENNLYPSEKTNALNQTTYTEYNLLNGQVATSIAENGAMTVNSFDPFGRLIKTEISSPSSTAELLTKQEIVYQDFEFPRYKETKDYFDLNQYKIQREYYDGLDRVIQTKTQMAESESWATQDTAYDIHGRVAYQTLPYITDSVDCSLSVCIAQEPLPLIPNEFTVEANTLSLWHMNGLVNSAEKKDNAEGYEPLDLVENNAPVSGSGFNDVFDGAYSLNKDLQQYLSVSDQSVLDIAEEMTIEVWVKFQSLPMNSISTFLAKNNSANNNQAYLFGYREDGGPAGLHVRLSSGGTDATTVSGLWPWAPSLDTWYYVAVTYDPSQELAANRVVTYINGVSRGTVSTPWPASIYNSDASFRLGASENGQHFDGVIDEVNILNRCKTSTEIGEYYNSFSPVREFDVNQPAKTYTYDSLDRVLTETTPVGTTTYEYNGFTTTIYDANNNRKDLTKDAYGNLVEVKEYNGQDVYTTNYEYTLTNKLSKITDAQGNIRNFAYDDLDNLVSQDMIHRPDAQNIPNITYTYDKNGNVLTETNFNNQTIVYTYDDLNRVLTESVNGSSRISYIYDQGANNVGKLTRVNYPYNGNWQTYNYNFLNQLTDYDVRINNDTYALNYAYNLNNDLKQIDYPNSKQAAYTFNNVGQVNGVSVNSSQIANNLSYNVNGQLVHLERANGLVTDYSYTPEQAYRLTNLSTTNATSTLQNISYTYDAVGNILNITDNANTDLAKSATYSYDDLNRLASTTVSYLNIPNSNYSQNFSYDAIGNILANSALGAYSYTLANPQQLSGVPNQNFVYDNAGNLLTDSQKTLTWDWRSRMIKSQNNGTSDYTSYEYDSQNQRLLKTTKRPTVIILPLAKSINNLSLTKPPVEIGQDIILTEEHYVDQYFERDDKNNDTKAHIFLNGQKIATINNNNAPYYIISDHLNSSSILVDNAGNIAEVSDYKPFGSEAYSNTIIDLDNDYNFTGKETDEESSLQYFGARYMDNDIGRFVSVDPVALVLHDGDKLKEITGQELQNILVDPQVLHAYAYSRNNPIILIDQNGEFFGDFGRDLAKGQRQIASFFHNAGNYVSDQGGAINKVSGFVSNSIGDFADNVANMYDPDKKAGTRILSFGLVALDSSTGGEGKAAVQFSKQFGRNLAIDAAKQGRHIIGEGYQAGKSILQHTDPQSLVNKFAGTGQKIFNQGVLQKEIVDFGQGIGQYFEKTTGKIFDTTRGTIHYSKSGTHIVPAKPNGF